MFIFGNIFSICMIENILDYKYETIEITEISSVTSQTELVPININPKLKEVNHSLALIPVKPVMKHKAINVDSDDFKKYHFEPKKPNTDTMMIQAEPKKPHMEIKKTDTKSLLVKGKQPIIKDKGIISPNSTITNSDDCKEMLLTLKKMIASKEGLSCNMIYDSR